MFVLGPRSRDAAVPTIVLAGEHYNMVARMLERGMPVKLRVNVQSHFVTDDPNSYNVVADSSRHRSAAEGRGRAARRRISIRGTPATGASDNADGAAAVLEAMRILKAVGAQPRRTIRVALWGGEEQGLLGSKAYVEQHLAGDANKAARDRLFVYLNLDPGTGPIYGWYLEDTPEAKALFDGWLAPLRDLGMRRNVLQGIGEHRSPQFPRGRDSRASTPIQEYATYDVRTHHTNVDTYERVREQDLKQNADRARLVRARRPPTPLSGSRAPPTRVGSSVRQFARRLARPDTSVAAGVLVSRLAGLVRVSLFSAFFGQVSEAADAFNAAFRHPQSSPEPLRRRRALWVVHPGPRGAPRPRRTRRRGTYRTYRLHAAHAHHVGAGAPGRARRTGARDA